MYRAHHLHQHHLPQRWGSQSHTVKRNSGEKITWHKSDSCFEYFRIGHSSNKCVHYLKEIGGFISHHLVFLFLLKTWWSSGTFMVPHKLWPNNHCPDNDLLQVALIWALIPDYKTHFWHPWNTFDFVCTDGRKKCTHRDSFPAPSIFKLLRLLHKELTTIVKLRLVQNR